MSGSDVRFARGVSCPGLRFEKGSVESTHKIPTSNFLWLFTGLYVSPQRGVSLFTRRHGLSYVNGVADSLIVNGGVAPLVAAHGRHVHHRFPRVHG